jgi:hypothetical protein
MSLPGSSRSWPFRQTGGGVGEGPTVAVGVAGVGVAVGTMILTCKKASFVGGGAIPVLVARNVMIRWPSDSPDGTASRIVTDREAPSASVIWLGDTCALHPEGTLSNVISNVAVSPVSFLSENAVTKTVGPPGTTLTLVVPGVQKKFAA